MKYLCLESLEIQSSALLISIEENAQHFQSEQFLFSLEMVSLFSVSLFLVSLLLFFVSVFVFFLCVSLRFSLRFSLPPFSYIRMQSELQSAFAGTFRQ